MKTQSASWYFTLALKVCGFNQGFSVKEKQKKKCLWTPGLKWFDHVQRRDWICWTQDVEHGSTRQEVKGKERRGGYGESWCNREESYESGEMEENDFLWVSPKGSRFNKKKI